MPRSLTQCAPAVADFKRLWCVFELANFCKLHQLDEFPSSDRLLLLSLTWPNPFNPFKNPNLTPEELSWMHSFSCKKAECFMPRDYATVLGAIRRECVGRSMDRLGPQKGY